MKLNKIMGCSKSTLTCLSATLWLIGCTLIGYMAWVLATSVTVKQFLSGNLVFTYVVVGSGFSLFVTGLMGWVAASSLSECLLKMYVMASVITIAAEVGGIITFNVMRLNMEDIVAQGWTQVNQDTRNAIQIQFECCGFSGPKEFAFNDDPIDVTCFQGTAIPPTNTVSAKDMDLAGILKQQGCGERLRIWLEENRVIWISVLAAVCFLELMGIVFAAYLVNRTRSLRRVDAINDQAQRDRDRGYIWSNPRDVIDS